MSLPISVAESDVCLTSARAAANAYGPPDPTDSTPSDGAMTSPEPETKSQDSATH